MLITVLFVTGVSVMAQNTVTTNVTPPSKQQQSQVSNLVSYLDHDTCLNKQFSIVFYVVLDSMYSDAPATQSTLAAMVNALNDNFRPICVSFVNCSTVFIPNYPFNKWQKYTTEPVVSQTWYTPNVINIYVVDSVKATGDIEIFGYANGPSLLPFPPVIAVPTRSDVIVLTKESLLLPNSYAALHHMGHFFGLPHTSDEISPNTATVSPGPPNTVISYEFVDRSNCAQHGDGFCDTEADNNSLTSLADGKGDYYIPPIDNFMAFYLTACRYSQQQLNYMARIIATRRLYLH